VAPGKAIVAIANLAWDWASREYQAAFGFNVPDEVGPKRQSFCTVSCIQLTPNNTMQLQVGPDAITVAKRDRVYKVRALV
jgi:hypothetical protein